MPPEYCCAHGHGHATCILHSKLGRALPPTVLIFAHVLPPFAQHVNGSLIHGWSPRPTWAVGFGGYATCETGSIFDETEVVVTGFRVRRGANVWPQKTRLRVSLNGQQVEHSQIDFTRYQQPTISSVSPAAGPVDGSTAVILSGREFAGGDNYTCRFANVIVPATLAKDRLTLGCTAPAAFNFAPASIPLALSPNAQQYPQPQQGTAGQFSVFGLTSISTTDQQSPMQFSREGDLMIVMPVRVGDTEKLKRPRKLAPIVSTKQPKSPQSPAKKAVSKKRATAPPATSDPMDEIEVSIAEANKALASAGKKLKSAKGSLNTARDQRTEDQEELKGFRSLFRSIKKLATGSN